MDNASAKKNFSAWKIISFGLGLALLYFLLRQIDFHSLLRLLLQVNLVYLLLGSLMYLGKAFTRTFRIMRLNQAVSPGFIRMLRLTLATGLASQLLPMKLGEFSYVYLLKKEHRSPISHGLSSLMAIRIIDLLAISLLFVLASLVFPTPGGLSIYLRSVMIFMGILLAMILGMLFLSVNERFNVQFLYRWHVVERFTILQKFVHAVEGFIVDFRQYQSLQYLEWLGLALLEWFINYAVFYLLLLGLGLTPTYFDTVVGVTFAALASVLPVNSFGNFGTQEAGWATGLILLGYSKDIALTSGFATHLLTLLFMLIFGGISWLSYLIQPGGQRNR